MATVHMASAAEVGMPDGWPINHINHKGGYPGFVQVAASGQLSWGDYAGNNVFSMLGEHPCIRQTVVKSHHLCIGLWEIVNLHGADACCIQAAWMPCTLLHHQIALLHVCQGISFRTKCLDSPTKLCTVTYVSFLAAGNLILDPEAALLFIDFTTGDTLHLSGRAEVHWDQVDLPGAQRTIIFQTEEWVHVKQALPIKQQGAVESSPYNPTPPSKPGKLQVWTCCDFS